MLLTYSLPLYAYFRHGYYKIVTMTFGQVHIGRTLLFYNYIFHTLHILCRDEVNTHKVLIHSRLLHHHIIRMLRLLSHFTHIFHLLNILHNCHVFTARRNARIASAVLSTAIPSVCPSVCHTPILCQNDCT